MSLDSLAVETAKPHTNRLYRTVSRYHEKGDLPICTATRLSVSSMDLSQPSVAARKEFWEERAKSREPSHPCRNCQVAQDIAEQITWLSLVYNKFLQVSMTSWIKQLQGIDHDPHSQQMEWVEARSCGEQLPIMIQTKKSDNCIFKTHTHTSLSSDWSKTRWETSWTIGHDKKRGSLFGESP